ncbi:hypothetical protein DFP75_103224 [Marinomonas alcarazii]|uniref:Uncharacterized protein n=1 Tax=Marinomonas alcarazii TaxID=491949 RepID=A0A318V0I5_9GAMM|nr:hypothetical protein [Marinomonas alcarazii]PYF82396.1 hypothetical protein DFP75_103224 [Marinomonas alcarazii]
MQRKSQSDNRGEKLYKAWGKHSVSELDDLIDIVRRKIDDEEKRQA